MSNKNILRQTAEELYQRELDALIAAETDPIPTGKIIDDATLATADSPCCVKYKRIQVDAPSLR